MERTGNYRHIELNRNYYQEGLRGEFDLYAVRNSGVVVYVERKERPMYNKAHKQFTRAKKAHPHYRMRFIYYDPNTYKIVTIK